MIGTVLALREALRIKPGPALLGVLGVMALCGLAWCWGLTVGRSDLAQAKASVQRQCEKDKQAGIDLAQRQRDQDRQAGDDAARGLRETLAQRDARIKDLLRRAPSAPAVIATPSCPAPGQLHLSASAVRLYDTALGGLDQQLLASSAGAAADATGACAAGSGCEQASKVSIDQFISVSNLNAERHGQCQERLRALVGFIRSRQQNASSQH